MCLNGERHVPLTFILLLEFSLILNYDLNDFDEWSLLLIKKVGGLRACERFLLDCCCCIDV